jgi:hypothetical protein
VESEHPYQPPASPTSDAIPYSRLSLTLFLSSSISIVAINRIWRTTPQPLAFGLAFAIFVIIFAVAEGDTSNGTDYWIMTFIYGTLLSLPVTMCFLARCTSRNRRGEILTADKRIAIGFNGCL